MKKQPLKYRLNVIGGSLILFLVIRTYMPIIGSLLKLNQNINVWMTFFIFTLITSCLLPILFIEKMCDFKPEIIKKQDFKLKDLAIICSCMALFILFSLINSIILIPLKKMGVEFPQSSLGTINSAITFFLYAAFTTIVPAVSEELYLRGTVLKLLEPYGKRFAIIVCALTFTLMHTQIQNLPAIFGAGVVLSCIYLYTDNILVPIGLHFLNNCYSFSMMYMQEKVNGISYTGYAVFVIFLIITIGIFCIIYLHKKDENIFLPLSESSKNAKVSYIFKSFVMMLGFLGCILAIVSQMISDFNI